MPQRVDEMTEDELLALLEQEELERKLARQDYHAFVSRICKNFDGGFKDGWHIHIIARIAHQIKYALDHPEDTEIPRVYVITMPPRHMKSANFARAIPLWLMGHNPRMEVIVGTCEGSLAKEHGDWIKNTATNDPLFQGIFPGFEVRPDSKAKDRLLTSQGGGVRCVGRGGGSVGRGAGLFIIDDPYKNDKEADSPATQKEVWDWYISVADSRLSPGGVTVIMHTRWRTGDLIGKVLQMYQETPEDEDDVGFGNICHVDFPLIATEDEYSPFDPKCLLRRKGEALHPARFDLRWAKRQKKKMFRAGDSGIRTWNAIYQQNPVVEEGAFFKRKYILGNLYNPGELPEDLIYYLPTDYAVTEDEDNDPTVLWPFGVDKHRNIWFLPEFFREWESTSYTIPKTIELAKSYDVDKILVEKGVIFQAIKPALEAEMDLQAAWFSLEGIPLGRNDKKMRARGIRALTERGKVFFPNTARFHEEILPELLMFPNGAHDDIVDNLSLAGNAVAELDTPEGKDGGNPDTVRTGYTPSGIKLRDPRARPTNRFDIRHPELYH